MTIFNWVHKKLHQNVIKDGEKKRSDGVSEIEKNTKLMLDQVGLVDALDNWFDGVLTIGTFGFDTLKFQDEVRDDDDDDDECDNLDYVVVDGSIIKNVVEQELDPLIISNENKFCERYGVLETDHIDSIKTVEIRPMISAEIEAKPELQKKRRTLKELFMEDQDNTKKSKNPNLDEDQVQNRDQDVSKPRSKFSFTNKKKMIKSKSKYQEEDEDLRPIKKMHQMMKKMLKKKKIHPDIDSVKTVKKEIQYKPNRKCEALESLHLLNDNKSLEI